MSQRLPAVWPICKQLCCLMPAWAPPPSPSAPPLGLLECVFVRACYAGAKVSSLGFTLSRRCSSAFGALFWVFFLHLALLVDQDGRWFGIGMVSRVLPQFGSVFRWFIMCVCVCMPLHPPALVCASVCERASVCVCVWHLIWRADRLKDMCCNCWLTVFIP